MPSDRKSSCACKVCRTAAVFTRIMCLFVNTGEFLSSCECLGFVVKVSFVNVTPVWLKLVFGLEVVLGLELVLGYP